MSEPVRFHPRDFNVRQAPDESEWFARLKRAVVTGVSSAIEHRHPDVGMSEVEVEVKETHDGELVARVVSPTGLSTRSDLDDD